MAGPVPTRYFWLPLLGTLLVSGAWARNRAESETGWVPGETTMMQEMGRGLTALPYYSVFDHLTYRFDGRTVTLGGQVRRPALRSDAETIARNVEGVRAVRNLIQVLPPSAEDQRIRMAEYAALYGQPSLSVYALWAAAPIHIVVADGRVTLDGLVASPEDRATAGRLAGSVAGVTSVENHLDIDQ